MEPTVVISIAGLGLSVNRLIEVVKKMPWFATLGDQVRWWLALLISVVIGIVLAFIFQFNAFPTLGTVVALQFVVTGVAIGGAANGLNSLSDFVAALIARLTPQELRSETSMAKAQAVSRVTPEKVLPAKALRVSNGG